MAKNTPAFQFYPQDFIGGTCHLSNEEVGLYIRLLSLLWIRGGRMPFEVERLARMTGTPLLEFDKLWQELQSKFEIADNILSHARFDEMIATRERRQAAGSLTGKLGGRPKKETQLKGNAKGNQNAIETHSKRNVMKNEDRRMKSEDCISEEQKEPKKRFVPPTVEEVKSYCLEQKLEFVDADDFFNFYASKGWMVGKNKMKNWKNAAGGWNNRHMKQKQNPTQLRPQDLPRSVKNEIAARQMKEAARKQHCEQLRIEGNQ